MNATTVPVQDDLEVWTDPGCITAEGVGLVEDLQEIHTLFSRRSQKAEPDGSLHAESLDLWAKDLSEKLNDGDLTVENVLTEFRASLEDQNHLAFCRLGDLQLRLERLSDRDDWVAVIHAN